MTDVRTHIIPSSINASSNHRTSSWVLAGATCILFGVIFALLLGINLSRELDHDEHQFIASAALIARTGLTPYVDFPYFHVPFLSYLYALLYTFSDSLLLSSRLLSVVFGWLSLLVVFAIAWQRFAVQSVWSRWWLASLAALWLLATPEFFYTSGRAWNHDLPLFLLVLAFSAFSQALSGKHQSGWLAICGVLSGLAAVTRLSFAFAAIPLLAAAWLVPATSKRQRGSNLLAFGLGGTVTALLVLAPAFRDLPAFLLGNIGYIQLNAQYFTGLSYGKAMSLAAKLIYFGDLLVTAPTNLIVLLSLAVGLWPVRSVLWRGQSSNHQAITTDQAVLSIRFRLILLLVLMFCLLPGALGATPSQPQYFYPIFPLAILAIVEAFAAWPALLQPGGLYAYALGALTAILVAVPVYSTGQTVLLAPNDWIPNWASAHGGLISRLVGDGKVLTLAPLYALEGDVAIYPEFATGPFAWRVAPQLAPGERSRFHIVGPEDLNNLFQAEPPRAILTGVEDDDAKLEQPLVDYAQVHEYVPVPLPDKSTLWLAPQAQWAQTIRLGGHDLPSTPVPPGASFVLTLHLQSLRPITTNLSTLIRVVDAQGDELLRGEGWPYGSATSQWQVGDVWPDGREFTVPDDAAPGYYRVDVSFYGSDMVEELAAPFTIGYLMVSNEESTPSTAPPLARFGGSIDLLAASVAQNAGDDATTLTVDTTWRALSPPERDYTLFVHLLDTTGNLVAQHDGTPIDGFLPTTVWRPALSVNNRSKFVLPHDLAPGEYRVVGGFYDTETLARIPITQAVTATEGNAYLIGAVQIP